MPKRILIDATHPEELRIVIADNRRLEDFDYESASKKQIKGNIYLAKVTRVEPSLQAAFVEYGGNKQGFLPFAEIHQDYYNIPASDNSGGDEATEGTVAPVPQVDSEVLVQAVDSSIESVQPLAPASSEPAFSTFVQEPAAPAGVYTFVSETTIPQSVVTDQAPSELPAVETAPEQYAAQNVPDATTGYVESAVESGNFAANEIGAVSDLDADSPVEIGDDEILARPKSNNRHRHYKIQDVIRRGQVMLVQVIKEERGNKGASLSSFISLPGRFCVLMPNAERQGGVSRRIDDPEDRRRLRDLMDSLETSPGMSVIIRTAGMTRSKPEIKRDFDYLQKLWNSIRDLTVSSSAPALIYEEGDLIKRYIRDRYDDTIQEILIEGDDAYQNARHFMGLLMPGEEDKVKIHNESVSLFTKFQIEEQLSELYDNKVQLKSGGSIVINPTEALVAIDVNSGRSNRERNVEETAVKTNLEAVFEVARQVRLRDLAGLIVIDFIDMEEPRNRRAVERAMRDALSADRARIQIGRISAFGLMEMSRQRLRSSLLESSTVPCPHCGGTGVIRAPETTVLQILRAIEHEADAGQLNPIEVLVSSEVAMFLLNNKRGDIVAIEQKYSVVVTVKADGNISSHNYIIVGREEATTTTRESGRSRGRGRGRNRDERPDRQASAQSSERAPISHNGAVLDPTAVAPDDLERFRDDSRDEYSDETMASGASAGGRRRNNSRRRHGRSGERVPREGAVRERAPRDNVAVDRTPDETGGDFVAPREAAFANGADGVSTNAEGAPRRPRRRRGGRRNGGEGHTGEARAPRQHQGQARQGSEGGAR